MTENTTMFEDEPMLFDDYQEEAEETTEAEPTAEAVEEEPKEQEAAEAEPFLTVRHNKQDRALTKEEAITYAQKGINYDHVAQELKSYREGPIGKALRAFADEAGMSVEKYAEMMVQQHEAKAEAEALEKMQEKWPEAPDDLLKELVRAQRAEAKKAAETAAEQRQQAAWGEVLSMWPDMTPANAPAEVLEAVANGVPPIQAVYAYKYNETQAENARLKAGNEAKEKQIQNRQRATGSVHSQPKKQGDGFLDEFA